VATCDLRVRDQALPASPVPMTEGAAVPSDAPSPIGATSGIPAPPLGSPASPVAVPPSELPPLMPPPESGAAPPVPVSPPGLQTVAAES
jgi:hypothetical protein